MIVLEYDVPYIYNCIRHTGSHKTFNKYKEETSQSQHCQHIREDIGLHQTDIFMNSVQRPFLDAYYFCIKLCHILSATCITDFSSEYNVHMICTLVHGTVNDCLNH